MVATKRGIVMEVLIAVAIVAFFASRAFAEPTDACDKVGAVGQVAADIKTGGAAQGSNVGEQLAIACSLIPVIGEAAQQAGNAFLDSGGSQVAGAIGDFFSGRLFADDPETFWDRVMKNVYAAKDKKDVVLTGTGFKRGVGEADKAVSAPVAGSNTRGGVLVSSTQVWWRGKTSIPIAPWTKDADSAVINYFVGQQAKLEATQLTNKWLVIDRTATSAGTTLEALLHSTPAGAGAKAFARFVGAFGDPRDDAALCIARIVAGLKDKHNRPTSTRVFPDGPGAVVTLSPPKVRAESSGKV